MSDPARARAGSGSDMDPVPAVGRASDDRSIQTYQGAEAVLHEAQQIQAHLDVQDAALEELSRRMKAGALRASPPA